MNLNKIVVHATSGEVISLYLNVSLACDYRIIADNTVFQNPFLELGLLPKGGGPFFISKKLGFSKAYEFYLLNKEIPAYEALRLGIVDRVVSFKELEREALELSHRFCQIPSPTLTGFKRLLNYSMKDLEDYLAFENDEFMKIIEGSYWSS